MENQPGMQHLAHHHAENDVRSPLSGMKSGKTGVVSHLEGDKDFMNRVASLGFTIGALVTVLQNHGQGPMIVSMLGAHIALGRKEADLIQVQPR